MRTKILYEHECDVCKKTEQTHIEKMPLGWSFYTIEEEAFLDSHKEKVLVCVSCKPNRGQSESWITHAFRKFFKSGDKK